MDQPRIESFPGFTRREQERLVGTLTLFCSDRALAEDLANEALARALADWDLVSGLDNPSAWLYRVAFNLATSSFRARAAERRALQRLSLSVEDAYADPDVTTLLLLRDAVAALPATQAKVFVCRYYLDMSVVQTAEVTGLTPGTVKMYTHRALKRVRELIPDWQMSGG